PFLRFGAEKLDSPCGVLKGRRCDRVRRETIGNGGNRNAGRQKLFEPFGVDALVPAHESAAGNRNQERRRLLRPSPPEIKHVSRVGSVSNMAVRRPRYVARAVTRARWLFLLRPSRLRNGGRRFLQLGVYGGSRTREAAQDDKHVP